jgi:hypothetical protein
LFRQHRRGILGSSRDIQNHNPDIQRSSPDIRMLYSRNIQRSSPDIRMRLHWLTGKMAEELGSALQSQREFAGFRYSRVVANLFSSDDDELWACDGSYVKGQWVEAKVKTPLQLTRLAGIQDVHQSPMRFVVQGSQDGHSFVNWCTSWIPGNAAVSGFRETLWQA